MRRKRDDKFVHKRRGDIAVVSYTSVTGGVGYRIKGARREYYSEWKNFLKNWKPLVDETDPPTREHVRDE